MYKKIITTFVAVVLIGGPLSLATARAQTVSTKTTINTAQLEQLLSLLVTELALLEQEYNSLIAEQASSTQALAQVEGEIGTATSTTSSTTSVSPTLTQIETVVPQVVQTSTWTQNSNQNSGTQSSVATAAPAPIIPTSTVYSASQLAFGGYDAPLQSIFKNCAENAPSLSNGDVVLGYLDGWESSYLKWGITSITVATDTNGITTDITFSPSLQTIVQSNALPVDESNGMVNETLLSNVESTTFPIVCGNYSIQ